MSKNEDSAAVFAGRAKHLNELARVFEHRNASWENMAGFLKHLFGIPAVGGNLTAGTANGITRELQLCRHNVGGQQHTELTQALLDPQQSALFNHPRYTRPCMGVGPWEENKNGGVVVHEMCIKAHHYLASIGVGDSSEPTGRDFNYDPGLFGSSSPMEMGSSQTDDYVDGVVLDGGEASLYEAGDPMDRTLTAAEFQSELALYHLVVVILRVFC